MLNNKKLIILLFLPIQTMLEYLFCNEGLKPKELSTTYTTKIKNDFYYYKNALRTKKDVSRLKQHTQFQKKIIYIRIQKNALSNKTFNYIKTTIANNVLLAFDFSNQCISASLMEKFGETFENKRVVHLNLSSFKYHRRNHFPSKLNKQTSFNDYRFITPWAFLEFFSSLTFLNVSNTNIPHECIRFIQNKNKLKTLILNNCHKITSWLFLKDCINLNVLDVSYTNITLKDLYAIKNKEKIKWLRLGGSNTIHFDKSTLEKEFPYAKIVIEK